MEKIEILNSYGVILQDLETLNTFSHIVSFLFEGPVPPIETVRSMVEKQEQMQVCKINNLGISPKETIKQEMPDLSKKFANILEQEGFELEN